MKGIHHLTAATSVGLVIIAGLAERAAPPSSTHQSVTILHTIDTATFLSGCG
jgi:uncharacterized membrane protein SirB2